MWISATTTLRSVVLDRSERVASEGRSRGYESCKRLTDIIGAGGALVVLAPVMLVIALLVGLTSPGPALFRQRRLGRGGRPFWCYKFRTMVSDAEHLLRDRQDLRRQFEANYKIKDDPRTTRLGAILRRTSLDELPQFWNVLRGDMSLIGPRPIVPPERSKYGDQAHTLLQVKPGLGGLWQVCGRSETTYEERVAMDIMYAKSCNFLLDMKLLVLTLKVVLLGRGAC